MRDGAARDGAARDGAAREWPTPAGSVPDAGAERFSTLMDRVTGGPGRPVVLIDGRSGSGKTTLGRAIAEALAGAQLVSLDDVYHGWYGLQGAAETVATSILDSVSPGYRRWNWTACISADWRTLDSAAPLVVEGAGSLTPASASRATLRIWVELDDATRKLRALSRDGDTYEPWWDIWAAQEERHLDRDGPRALADLVWFG